MPNYYIMRDGQKLYKKTVKEISKAAVALANATGLPVPVHVDHGLGLKTRAGVQRGVTFARNPMMQGQEFSGEQWVIKGIAPNGRKYTGYASSRDEAEREADYAHDNRGIRAITVRRTQAPMKRNPAKRKQPSKLPVMLTIYNQGRADHKAGWLISDNPYVGAPKEKAMWLKGYRAGKR